MSIYSETEVPFRPTYLYIKQHSVTGKLYFGKTIQNPEKYPGSGNHWKNHTKKYGKEFIVTLWYCLFYDLKSIKDFALMCSNQWDIVESEIWLNRIPENGLDGQGIPKGYKHSEESRQQSKIRSKGEGNPMFGVHRFGEANPFYGRHHTEESKSNWSREKRFECPHCGIWTNRGNLTRYHLNKCLKNPNKTSREVFICPHCGKQSTNKGNMTRYHFNNCLQYPDSSIRRKKPIKNPIICPHCDYKNFKPWYMKRYHFGNCRHKSK